MLKFCKIYGKLAAAMRCNISIDEILHEFHWLANIFSVKVYFRQKFTGVQVRRIRDCIVICLNEFIYGTDLARKKSELILPKAIKRNQRRN